MLPARRWAIPRFTYAPSFAGFKKMISVQATTAAGELSARHRRHVFAWAPVSTAAIRQTQASGNARDRTLVLHTTLAGATLLRTCFFHTLMPTTRAAAVRRAGLIRRAFR